MDSNNSEPNPLKWLLVFPGAIVSIFIADVLCRLLWSELIFSVFGGENARMFFQVAVVNPAVVVYSASGIAPSNKDKVAWIFAGLWAVLMAIGMLANMNVDDSRTAQILSQLCGIGVGFAAASSISSTKPTQ